MELKLKMLRKRMNQSCSNRTFMELKLHTVLGDLLTVKHVLIVPLWN